MRAKTSSMSICRNLGDLPPGNPTVAYLLYLCVARKRTTAIVGLEMVYVIANLRSHKLVRSKAVKPNKTMYTALPS